MCFTKRIKGLLFRTNGPGNWVILESGQTEEIAALMQKHGFTDLEVNRSWYRSPNLEPLRKFAFLKALTILHQGVEDLRPIHALRNLRVLNVDTYCRSEIDFNAFPRLEECLLYWRPKARSVFACSTLKSLVLDHYDRKDASEIANLTGLESLSIANSRTSDLSDLSKLKKLEGLGLVNLRGLSSIEGVVRLTWLTRLYMAGLSKMTSLAGIENLSHLRELKLDSCRKLASIDEMAALPGLCELWLRNCGVHDSLKPLANLKHLEKLDLAGDTKIIDGDLSCLEALPRLKTVYFRHRRHYSHRPEDLRLRGTRPS